MKKTKQNKTKQNKTKQNKRNKEKTKKQSILFGDRWVCYRWPVIAGTSEERTRDTMGTTEIEPTYFYSFYS